MIWRHNGILDGNHGAVKKEITRQTTLAARTVGECCVKDSDVGPALSRTWAWEDVAASREKYSIR